MSAHPGAGKPRFATLRSIVALMLREMASTYGRSPGGYLWALLEPVGAIFLLSVVFSYAFRAPALGTNFPLFFATAYLPFMIFNDISTKVGQAILFSKPLLIYPAVTFVDGVLARFFLNAITHIMVFYIVICGIHIIFDMRSIVDYIDIFSTLIATSLLGFSVGVVNCFLFMRLPFWQYVWSILMRPAFILSGIFFLFEDIPRELSQYLWFNPVIHLTGLMRSAFYTTYDPAYISLTYVYLITCTLSSIGILLLRYHYHDLIER